MTAPDPFIDPEVDLSDFPYMALDVRRLRDSALAAIASGDAFRAAVLLWCASWHQLPAGSLPNDDRQLMRYAGVDAAAWPDVREHALHGFVLCSDNRLYHALICEKAIDAWAKRRAASKKGRAGAKARFEREQKMKRDLAAAQASPGLSTGTAQANPNSAQAEPGLATAQPVFSNRKGKGELREIGQEGDLNRGIDPTTKEEYPRAHAREGAV